MKKLLRLMAARPIKNSLSENILRGILQYYTILLLLVFISTILIFSLFSNKIEKYTCNYLSSTSELLGYQVGRELAFKNSAVANELLIQYSQSIQSVIPGKLLEFAISDNLSVYLGKKWQCKLDFNRIEFNRQIGFGELNAGFLKGEIKLYDGWYFFLLFAVFIFSATFIIYSLGNYMYKLFLTHILSPLKSIVSSNFDTSNADLTIEMKEIVSRIIDSHNKLIDSEKKLALAHSQIELSNLAYQVSHDIKSPISALNMILSQIDSLPDQTRILIRSSVNRINDIANSLLIHGKMKNSNNSIAKANSLENTLLASLVDEVVSEKRIAFREKDNLQIESRLQNSYGLFAIVNSIEMKRLISNAINNASEAFGSNLGRIEVILDSTDNEVSLIVKDNGKGIPTHILAKLGQKGVSYGKEGTDSGSGLGVYHAKVTIESFGGKYEIQSQVGQGTSVIIRLKKESPPAWFVQKIVLKQKQYILATDDDNSILQMWKERFSKYVSSNVVELVTFTTGNSLKDWLANNHESVKNILFLMDFELIGQKQTGLDLIESLGIGAQSILVSSRFEEISIRERCNKLGVKMIPKGMASLVSIELENDDQHEFDGQVTDKKLSINEPSIKQNILVEDLDKKMRYDLCLIDDDIQLVHALWGMVAKSKGLNIKMFSNPKAFLAVVDSIDRQTPIYVDVSLGDGISGIDFTYEINKLGFVEINLATGYPADSIVVPPFICRVVGKDPVF